MQNPTPAPTQQPTGSFVIQKHVPLHGAKDDIFTFEIWHGDTLYRTVELKLSSNTYGHEEVVDMPYGTYIVREKVPQNYTVTPTEVTIIIDENSRAREVEGKNKVIAEFTNYYNTPTPKPTATPSPTVTVRPTITPGPLPSETPTPTEIVEIPEDEPTIIIGARKIWNDVDDEVMRPEAIYITLFADGQNIKNIKLSKDNNWFVTVEVLQYNQEGNEIIYEWREHEIIGYHLESKTIQDNVTTFINRPFDRPIIPEGQPQPKIPGKPIYVFTDYDTPLGVEVMINHVGDCFE